MPLCVFEVTHMKGMSTILLWLRSSLNRLVMFQNARRGTTRMRLWERSSTARWWNIRILIGHRSLEYSVVSRMHWILARWKRRRCLNGVLPLMRGLYSGESTWELLGVCSFCWFVWKFLWALIAFLIVLQWKCENLLGEKQPKFTQTIILLSYYWVALKKHTIIQR